MLAIYIISGIILLIAFLSFVKINLNIDFYYKSDDNSIYIRYLFFKRTLFPSEKKEKKPKKEKEPEAEHKKDKKKKEKPKKSFEEQTEKIISVYNAVKHDVTELLGYLFKKTFTVKEVTLSALIGTGDPMYTGLACGGVYTIVYGALEALRVKDQNVSISADFDNKTINGGVHAVIYTRLAHVYVLAAKLIVIGIKVLRRL